MPPSCPVNGIHLLPLTSERIETVVDLGCNTGEYSLAVAGIADRVLSVDMDPACINILFKNIKRLQISNVFPIVGDLLNPSPGLGWEFLERKPLLKRIQSNAFLALALVHHICIGGNVPVQKFVLTLSRLGSSGVVEWVGKDDPMIQRMLRNRTDVFEEYTWEHFQEALNDKFIIKKVLKINQGTRKLCHVAVRP